MVVYSKNRVLAVVTLCILIYVTISHVHILLPLETTEILPQESHIQAETYLTEGELPPLEIVLWISPVAPPTKSRISQLEKFVRRMNSATCLEKCRFSMSVNGSIESADAVAFFMFTEGYKLSELPSTRSPEQLWVAYLMEPPVYLYFKDPLENIFNWTLSYRSDSDVVNPYGQTLPRSDLENKSDLRVGSVPLEEWLKNKSKLVAAVISNCNTLSNRESLIQELNSTGIGVVDVFGKCGNTPSCARYATNCTDFWTDLSRQYLFYLAFENSLCSEYITEKFWRSLDLGMIPVVYGGGDYLKKAPPGSFINVDDFLSPLELMTYLHKLSLDLSLNSDYVKFFEWRRDYTLAHDEWYWCNLCEAVGQHRRTQGQGAPPKVYSNLEYWWKHKSNSNLSACERRPSTFLFKEFCKFK